MVNLVLSIKKGQEIAQAVKKAIDNFDITTYTVENYIQNTSTVVTPRGIQVIYTDPTISDIYEGMLRNMSFSPAIIHYLLF